jgi:CubicO group peptidase (beta-lactamase class C family)
MSILKASSEKVQSMKDWMQSWTESGVSPGLMVGIYDRNNEELFYHAVNNTCLPKDGKQYDKDAMFRIHSLTKPIISVGILLLIERKQLSLDGEVSNFIPSFKNTKVLKNDPDATITKYEVEDLNIPLTIKHLLSHTGGINSYGLFSNSLVDQLLRSNIGADIVNLGALTPLEELCEKIAKAPLAFQPGTSFQYGWSVDVLGRVIEVVTGATLDVFCEQEMFIPLGMTDTYFRVPDDKLHRLVDMYVVAPPMNLAPYTSVEGDRSSKRILLSGGAGLVSTLSDYSKFANMMLNKGVIHNESGKHLFLSEKSVTLATTNHLPNNQDMLEAGYDKAFMEFLGLPGLGFGLGFSVVMDPEKIKGGSLTNVGEFGWVGYGGTICAIDPVEGTTTILMTQLASSSETYPIKRQLRWWSHYLFR